jgi:hypothetical protein
MDVSTLSPRQRANVAGLQLKRESIKRKYGNNIQIVTTDEEAAMASGWMATPISLVNTNKQLSVRLDKQVIDTIKSQKLSEVPRDEEKLVDNGEDLVTALERSVEELKGRPVTNKAAAKAVTPVVATTRPVTSSMSDADFISNLLGK